MSIWPAFRGRTTKQAGMTRPVGRISADDVHNVAFSKPPIGQRGYNMDEVDTFLALVADSFRRDPRAARITPLDIHNVAFSKPPIGQRGYNEDEVDAFLNTCKTELEQRLQEG